MNNNLFLANLTTLACQESYCTSDIYAVESGPLPYGLSICQSTELINWIQSICPKLGECSQYHILNFTRG